MNEKITVNLVNQNDLDIKQINTDFFKSLNKLFELEKKNFGSMDNFTNHLTYTVKKVNENIFNHNSLAIGLIDNSHVLKELNKSIDLLKSEIFNPNLVLEEDSKVTNMVIGYRISFKNIIDTILIEKQKEKSNRFIFTLVEKYNKYINNLPFILIFYFTENYIFGFNYYPESYLELFCDLFNIFVCFTYLKGLFNDD